MQTGPATDLGGPDQPVPGARGALMVLLAINLFNYIDRQVLSAVLAHLEIDGTIIRRNDPDGKLKLGLLTSAFMVTYMLFSPVFGWLDGRGAAVGGPRRRRDGVELGVRRVRPGNRVLDAVRDTLPGRHRRSGLRTGRVGHACGRVPGPAARAGASRVQCRHPDRQRPRVRHRRADLMLTDDWRPAFWFTFSGLILGAVCFTKKELPRPAGTTGDGHPSYWAVLKALARNRSFALCCAGMTAITFVMGGVAAWVPAYFFQREARFEVTPAALTKLEGMLPAGEVDKLRPLADGTERTYPEMKGAVTAALGASAQHYSDKVFAAATTPASPSSGGLSIVFGGILVIGGIASTITGAWLGEKLRKGGVRGAYFLVSAGGAVFAIPCFLGILNTPLPLSWGCAFLAIFGLFLYTGPGNTILANVVKSDIRGTAFAINVLVIHALGDVISPPLIGAVADATSLQFAFMLTTTLIGVGAVLWLLGMRYLDKDTAKADAPTAG